MIETIIGIVIAISVLYSGIWAILEFDKETRISYKPSITLLVAIGVGIVIIQNKLSGVDYWFFALLVGYLALSAYTDIQTMLLYSIFSYIFMIIGAGYSIINQVNIEKIWIMLVFIAISWIFGKMKVYGEGDSEMFAVAGVFIVNLVDSEYHIYLMLLLFLASIIAAIMGVARIKVTKESLRTKMPFAPGIGVAVLLLVGYII